MTSAWKAHQVAQIADQAVATMPLIDANLATRLFDDLVLWDMWPLQTPTGHIADINAGVLWMALSAPYCGDPARRHFEAKIRLLRFADNQWSDLGPVLPDFDVPYEREWAGTALLDDGRVSLFFTGAGLKDTPGGYQQRLFEAHAQLKDDGQITGWSVPRESLVNTGELYACADQQDGEPGKITAFRDPSYFRDPADGAEYLVFSASLKDSTSHYRGAIGIAKKQTHGAWKLLPHLLHANGVNNELERAHVVFKDGHYYLFWVTQTFTFNPDGPVGPAGLYGMVAGDLRGLYRPLNGTGLVLANPKQEPYQIYSWHVTADLLVSSFIDHWGTKGEGLRDNPALAARSFSGTPAPFVYLFLDGDIASLQQCDAAAI